MSAATDTVQPGQWLLHLTNAPDKKWRYLEEITPDPFGYPDMVVLKFSNGDGDRLHEGHLLVVNDQLFLGPPRVMWEVSETKPAEGVAIGRTASRWLTKGKLTELTERTDGDEQWVEAKLDGGRFGVHIVELPATPREDLAEELVLGVEVEMVTPALSDGTPGVTEVTAGGRTWADPDGVPISRGFLAAHDLIAEAYPNCAIVPHVWVR